MAYKLKKWKEAIFRELSLELKTKGDEEVHKAKLFTKNKVKSFH